MSSCFKVFCTQNSMKQFSLLILNVSRVFQHVLVSVWYSSNFVYSSQKYIKKDTMLIPQLLRDPKRKYVIIFTVVVSTKCKTYYLLFEKISVCCLRSPPTHL